MDEPKRIRVYYEGNDDRNLLEQLRAADMLPNNWEIATRSEKLGGAEGMLQDALPFVRPVDGVAGRAVLLVDLDDRDNARLTTWFESTLARLAGAGTTCTPLPAPTPRTTVVRLQAGERQGLAALVGVGLPRRS